MCIYDYAKVNGCRIAMSSGGHRGGKNATNEVKLHDFSAFDAKSHARHYMIEFRVHTERLQHIPLQNR